MVPESDELRAETEEDEEKKAPEELTLEEFQELEEAPEGVRRRKVNYEKVLEEMMGRALSVKKIAAIIMSHSVEKQTVYYSEVTGFLQRLAKSKKFRVEKKFKDIIYYRVMKVADVKKGK